MLSEKPLIDNESASHGKQNIPECKQNATVTDKPPNVPELKIDTMDVDPTAQPDATPKDVPECPTTPNTPKKTSGGTPNKTPRRVQLITLSSPNRKRKMDEEKIKETIQLNDSRKLFETNSDKKLKEETSVEEDVCMEEVKSEPEAHETAKLDKVTENTNGSISDPNEHKDDKTEEKSEIDPSQKPEQEKSKEKCSSPVEKLEENHENIEAVCNKTVDFDFDCVLENTGDSILNPSFVDDSPKSCKNSSIAPKSANDFSSLSETLLKKSTAENLADDKSKDESRASTVPGASALTSPLRDSGAKPSHVFTPPRAVHSPKQGTPGRRVQLITLSSPKVKPKDK